MVKAINGNRTKSDNGGGKEEENWSDAMEEELETAMEEAAEEESRRSYSLDCYPYTFSPLLLFSESSYFDKGYSNYNAVAQFFSPALTSSSSSSSSSSSTTALSSSAKKGVGEDTLISDVESDTMDNENNNIHVDMLQNVLYDRKNMLYENLLEYVTSNKMLVTCCIDAHFTAFQIISNGRSPTLIYYDPLKPYLYKVSGEGFKILVTFLLLKCNYGDGQHVQENKGYYTGSGSNSVKRNIYQLWKRINALDVSNLHGVKFTQVRLDLDDYYLINARNAYQSMSTQLTGNTCYFQTYLFAVLCKVCDPILLNNNTTVRLHNLPKLRRVTSRLCHFLLNFFVDDASQIMRPLTNNNVILDFHRYENAPYYKTMIYYLRYIREVAPNYERQYRDLMEYFTSTKTLHTYSRFSFDGNMASTANTKVLHPVYSTEDGARKLARSDYYRYRPANLMFGCNAGILHGIHCFAEFNSWRKNQLLRFYDELKPLIGGCGKSLTLSLASKYRDYYFMPQYEIGQKELVDVHHYSYLIDLCSIWEDADQSLMARVRAVNQFLQKHILFSTQKRSTYDKLLSTEQFAKAKKYSTFFMETFLSVEFLSQFVGLGFAEINPKEKDVNSLTQTVFYSTELMRTQANRLEYEFEKECINQMARSSLRRYCNRFEGDQDISQTYNVNIVKIGQGFTYSKYNTLMHFLNVTECYWHNPDLNNVQVFGKDIRALLAISSQKIFFQKDHPSGFYHYGPFESMFGQSYRKEMDLAVASATGYAAPSVCRQKRGGWNQLVLTDRVYEYNYLRGILKGMLERANGVTFKSDNVVLNLSLLSLMLDFGLYEKHAKLLNLPFMQELQHVSNTRELQVEVANLIYEFDRKNNADSVTRSKVEELIFETSYKFLINKDFPVNSKQFQLIRMLNADPDYQEYILLCKIYMSLCQINKSIEVDYYKVQCDGEFHIIIPLNFSKSISDYLESVTKRYTFSEKDGIMMYDDLPVFDLRPSQPEINLHKVRLDSATSEQSMVKYIEIKNVFRALESEHQYLVFIADNALLVDSSDADEMKIRINKIAVQVATIFFNAAISFVPCFKYADSEDVILFASRNIHYLVDQGGQFCTDYYGMKHELIESIYSEEVFVDLNDEHVFKKYKLSELLTESKTVIYYPDYLLQVHGRQQLINLLDFAIYVRNVSFFILVLFYLRRGSVYLEYVNKEENVIKITGPWKEAILYVLDRTNANPHYDAIFEKQFFNLNQHKDLPLDVFIEVLCKNFTKYQRFTEDGQYQIIPTAKQKKFLQRIICADECFHFSEVGSGKTKVIMPLLCQTFLSNNVEAHNYFRRGGELKDTLVILVPEHLVADAQEQVYRYCLNLNFREEYRVYDDIFVLQNKHVQLGSHSRFPKSAQPPMKQIFVTSFNQFKKALTYDKICDKVRPHRDHILVIADEVDDFLDRDKLVFNICSNKSNAFDRSTLDLFFEVSRAAYHEESCPDALLNSSDNPKYWKQLFEKFGVIHREIQDASRSVNKSFGIFNEQTLRHCTTNITHDVEGYKSLIARPYESVNRAMAGSYYSDVERTIYLTYVILTEDIAKYDELFQSERKFITFEYWNEHLHHLDYDELVYGHDKLSELVNIHPETKGGLNRFLYEIILRRMEIRDKSRSVNSIDIIFNFDCIGFTGTPFLDNYPTFDYIRHQRKDDIPDCIDRSFYAYSCDELSTEEFEERFARFQGQNNDVDVEYVPSDFMHNSLEVGEMATLKSIFEREEETSSTASTTKTSESNSPCSGAGSFNVIVDLCGIFKLSSIHDVRDLVRSHFGPDRFHYIYHIDQTDSSDRMLCISSDNDVQFDEEFYKHLCKTYGAGLREKVFFFIDNRNFIGKDVPFQLVYRHHFGQPLFTKSVVLAHDVEDFSKIWQAMGRSRTMNETIFSIYKSDIPSGLVKEGVGAYDIKKQELSRLLYVRNCDCKMAGNLSSIYQTMIALYNLSQESFYYCDEIVNSFLEKMEMTIAGKVEQLQERLSKYVLKTSVPSQIFLHILVDKFRRSSNKAVAGTKLAGEMVGQLLSQLVEQKFEQRNPSADIYDEFIFFLSGDQRTLMEISYTKQQQKQKQKQQNKSQDSDTMDYFDKKNQLFLSIETENYFEYTFDPQCDLTKLALNLPVSVPILTATYNLNGKLHSINVYPTLQFLYSHHIQATYITPEVKDILKDFNDINKFYNRFLETITSQQRTTYDDSGFDLGQTVMVHGSGSAKHDGKRGRIENYGKKDGTWCVKLFGPDGDDERFFIKEENLKIAATGARESAVGQLDVKVRLNNIRDHPQYTIAALEPGSYIIGMRDQFNIHDLRSQPLQERIQYISDEIGFILFDKTGSNSVDKFGPYFIEQYMLMEVLSKQEVAQNVLEYYCSHKEKLERCLQHYSETQGKGFICWRFLINEIAKAEAKGDGDESCDMSLDDDSNEVSAKREWSAI